MIEDVLENALRALREYKNACEKAEIYDGVVSKPNTGAGCINNDNSVERQYVNAVHYHTERDNARERLCNARAEAERCIMLLDDPRDRTILRDRYIYGYSWDMISSLTGYTVRQLLRRRNKAARRPYSSPEVG